MKIRIKDNTIRLRLTKTDVSQLKENGLITCKTVITPEQVFQYTLKVDATIQSFSASFESNTMTISLSESQAHILTDTDDITIKGSQKNGEDGDLFILIEKDLQCLDESDEDQSDMYENKKTVC
jgi:hypothetical protein